MNEVFNEISKNIVPWLVSHGLKILIILIGAYFLHKLSRRFIAKLVQISVIKDEPIINEVAKKREETLVRIFYWLNGIVILVVSVLMILQEIGISIGPLLAGAGILGLAIGFGVQYLIKDLISGFFIFLENQYRIGDVVRFDGVGGTVEDITLRVTTLRDLDGVVHHIPHGEIKRVSNLSKTFARVNLNIGVSYNARLEHVIEVINTICENMAKESPWNEYIIKTPKFLRVEEFADSAIVLKILGDTIPHKHLEVTGELRKRIKLAFDAEGIEIPFPQRVIHMVEKPHKGDS
jgi:moderate conductance mechanosensitive channel